MPNDVNFDDVPVLEVKTPRKESVLTKIFRSAVNKIDDICYGKPRIACDTGFQTHYFNFILKGSYGPLSWTIRPEWISDDSVQTIYTIVNSRLRSLRGPPPAFTFNIEVKS